MRHWRWIVVLSGVTALCLLPVVIALRPVPTSGLSTAEVVAQVTDSADSSFEGLFESHGGLRLPDLGRFDDEIAPFTQTSRVRVWYQNPERWRTDELLIGAERSIYREPGGMWLWDSGTRRVVYSPREATEPLRIPRLMDLNPAELGRRLLRESAGETVRRIDDRWVAGQASVGLRIEPSDEAGTIEAVELWVDPDTGVVTAVEIETGGTAPAFETEFVDLEFLQPSVDVMQFDPAGAGQPVRTTATVDPVESVGDAGFLRLPDELAGLQRRNDPDTGLATYGQGLSVVSMFALPQGNLGRRINELPRTERPWGGDAVVVSTSLVNVQIVTVAGFDVVLSGTVDVSELDRIAGVLVDQGGFLCNVSSVVRTTALTKRFPGGLLAVDGIDLDVRAGDLYGFLGPNGAGKTTTIRMLLSLIAPTSGSIEVLGHEVTLHSPHALDGVGTMVEGPAFYPYLSGERNLMIFDGAGSGGPKKTRRQRVRDVIERVGLTDVGDRPVKAYSLGMRQRLGLASALLRAPALLVLDEPTNGLDAQGIHELRTMFVELVREGTTIMLSSHLLAEVELICTRAAMMSAGRIVAQDDVRNLLAPTGWVRVVTPDLERAVRALQDGPFRYVPVDAHTVRVNIGDRAPELLNKAFVQDDIRVRELIVERPTLEDVFLERTGHGDIR